MGNPNEQIFNEIDNELFGEIDKEIGFKSSASPSPKVSPFLSNQSSVSPSDIISGTYPLKLGNIMSDRIQEGVTKAIERDTPSIDWNKSVLRNQVPKTAGFIAPGLEIAEKVRPLLAPIKSSTILRAAADPRTWDISGASPRVRNIAELPIRKVESFGVPKNVDKYIEKNVTTILRPRVKTQAGQLERYANQSTDAVKDIVANKDKLGLVDEFGDAVSRTPESLHETLTGVKNLKKGIYEEYSALPKAAWDKGITVNTSKIGNDVISEFSKGKYALSPEIQKKAMEEAEILKNAGEMAPADVESHLERLNQILSSYFKRGVYETGRAADVDAFVSRKLRESLDTAIEGATGKQYQGLKNRYANLKAIENDLVRRYGVDARKSVKGFFDLADIFGDSEIVRGLLTLNPGDIAQGLAKKGIVKLIKRSNDPNRQIKKMFSVVDKSIGRPGGVVKQLPVLEGELLDDSATNALKYASAPKQGMIPNRSRMGLPFRPQTENLGRPVEVNTPERVQTLLSRLKGVTDTIPYLRRRGMVNEAANAEREARALFDEISSIEQTMKNERQAFDIRGDIGFRKKY